MTYHPVSVDLLYLEDMIAYGQDAVDCTKTFRSSKKDYYAAAHCITILGEAANKTSVQFRKENPGIPWREIIGMRNRIIHDYAHVDLDIMEKALTDELPELIRHLRVVLHNLQQ